MSLQHCLENIIKNKNIIIHNWLNNNEVEKIFKKYDLNKEVFSSQYADIILNFYSNYINNNSNLNSTKEIDRLLQFFENKKVKNYEIFIICKNFKMVLLEYLNDSSMVTQEIEKEVNEIFDLSYTIIAKQYFLSIEKIIKDQQDILIEQSKSAAMGEMISMIAHQWRQPLNSISVSVMNIQMKLELEKYDFDKKEDIDKFIIFLNEKLTNIENFTQSLTLTIDDFRNFYKPNKEHSYLNVNKSVQTAINIIKPSLESKSTQVKQQYNSSQNINIFKNELMQVILNILKNAQDHFVSQKTVNPILDIKTRDEEHSVIIEICDNAGGIPVDIIGKIFDPYFSTKEEQSGSGLGLYMSKIIIEEHHKGQFIIKNINDGVCAKIILPIVLSTDNQQKTK